MNNVPYLITNETICVTFDHKPYYVYKYSDDGFEESKFNQVKDLIKEKDFEAIKEIVLPKAKVIKATTEYFIITDENQIFMKDAMDEELPNALTDRLIEFVDEELPIEPLVNFWINLRKNPTETSKESLYRFLEHNKMSITEDGMFIAYKAVNYDRTDDYTNGLLTSHGDIMNMPQSVRDHVKLIDVYTKTIDNSIGAFVTMERDTVDHDPNHTCSAGLHVAAFKYAKHSYSGDVVIEVKVNPMDVVSVPYDYNNQKMRVCKYKTVDYITIAKQENLEKGKVDNIYYDRTVAYDDDFENELMIDEQDELEEVDLIGKTAANVVELVKAMTGDEIKFSLKSKKSIVRKAKELLESNGYDVKINPEYQK